MYGRIAKILAETRRLFGVIVPPMLWNPGCVLAILRIYRSTIYHVPTHMARQCKMVLKQRPDNDTPPRRVVSVQHIIQRNGLKDLRKFYCMSRGRRGPVWLLNALSTLSNEMSRKSCTRILCDAYKHYKLCGTITMVFLGHHYSAETAIKNEGR
ncbi:hypothetical protein EDC04DRAFT_1732988 [Pisolithus marmoratus]|nr:hypothetical protein EDC04DRAFT_1732988 [Pisolithus marmoratus]